MAQSYEPGDFLIYQLESGYGLLRVLGFEEDKQERTWHVSVYEELFPDAEWAETAAESPGDLHLSKPHLALTERAFDRTPTAKLKNVPLTGNDLTPYRQWHQSPERHVHDRSLLLLLGMR
jgi:hypothetical protein